MDVTSCTYLHSFTLDGYWQVCNRGVGKAFSFALNRKVSSADKSSQVCLVALLGLLPRETEKYLTWSQDTGIEMILCIHFCIATDSQSQHINAFGTPASVLKQSPRIEFFVLVGQCCWQSFLTAIIYTVNITLTRAVLTVNIKLCHLRSVSTVIIRK